MAWKYLSVLLFLAACLQAHARHEILIEVSQPVLAPGESTTVTLRGAIVQWEDYALAFVATNLLSSTGGDGWSDMELIHPMTGPGTSHGELLPTGVEGIRAGQLNLPFGVGADTANPMSFWRATYTAPVEVGLPFDVALSTRSSEYAVYPSRDSMLSESRLSTLIEGHATIHIIPAPAGAVVLGLGVLVAGRRRR